MKGISTSFKSLFRALNAVYFNAEKESPRKVKYSGTRLRIAGERGKKSGWVEKKKQLASEASREVVWGG